MLFGCPKSHCTKKSHMLQAKQQWKHKIFAAVHQMCSTCKRYLYRCIQTYTQHMITYILYTYSGISCYANCVNTTTKFKDHCRQSTCVNCIQSFAQALSERFDDSPLNHLTLYTPSFLVRLYD